MPRTAQHDKVRELIDFEETICGSHVVNYLTGEQLPRIC